MFEQINIGFREIRETFKISIPLISSQMINAICTFLITIIVSNLGENYLAANVIVSSVWVSITTFFLGILNSISILISHEFGANRYLAMKLIIYNAFVFGLVVAILIIIILLFVPVVIIYNNQPVEIIMPINEYIYSLVFATPSLVFLVVIEHIFISIGHSNVIMKMNFIIMPVELILLYIFVLGKFGCPMLGMAGIGLVLSVTYTFAALYCGFYLFRTPLLKTKHNELLKLQITEIKKILSLGLPIGLSNTIELSTFTLMSLYISHCGTNMLIAHQITLQYFSLSVTIIVAMAQALTIRISYSMGKQDFYGVKLSIYHNVGINLFFIIFVSIVFIMFSTRLLEVDIDPYAPQNADIVKYAAELFTVSGVILLFEAIRITGSGALRGLKDTTAILLISICGFYIVGVGVAYFFSKVHHLGALGSWYGLLFGVVFSTILTCIRLIFITTNNRSTKDRF